MPRRIEQPADKGESRALLVIRHIHEKPDRTMHCCSRRPWPLPQGIRVRPFFKEIWHGPGEERTLEEAQKGAGFRKIKPWKERFLVRGVVEAAIFTSADRGPELSFGCRKGEACFEIVKKRLLWLRDHKYTGPARQKHDPKTGRWPGCSETLDHRYDPKKGRMVALRKRISTVPKMGPVVMELDYVLRGSGRIQIDPTADAEDLLERICRECDRVFSRYRESELPSSTVRDLVDFYPRRKQAALRLIRLSQKPRPGTRSDIAGQDALALAMMAALLGCTPQAVRKHFRLLPGGGLLGPGFRISRTGF